MKENENDLNKQVSSEQLEDVSGGYINWDSYDEEWNVIDDNTGELIGYNGTKKAAEEKARMRGFSIDEIQDEDWHKLVEAQNAKKSRK